MGQPLKKEHMPAPATAPANSAKAKLLRYRAIAKERRYETKGDLNAMHEEDRKVFEAYRDSRDRANKTK